MIWSLLPGSNCRFDAGTYIYTSNTAIPCTICRGAGPDCLAGNHTIKTWWKNLQCERSITWLKYTTFFYRERFLRWEDLSNTNWNHFNVCIPFLPLWNDPRLALALALGNVLLVCISGGWEIRNKLSLPLANVKHHTADAWSPAQWGWRKTIADPCHRTHCNGESGLWLSI